jgi:hypothetical protein
MNECHCFLASWQQGGMAFGNRSRLRPGTVGCASGVTATEDWTGPVS